MSLILQTLLISVIFFTYSYQEYMLDASNEICMK